jgi:hypothetical protein
MEPSRARRASTLVLTLRSATGAVAAEVRIRTLPEFLHARRILGAAAPSAIPTAEVLDVLGHFAQQVQAVGFSVWEPLGAIPLFLEALGVGGKDAVVFPTASTEEERLVVLVAPPTAQAAELIRAASAANAAGVVLLDTPWSPTLTQATNQTTWHLANVCAAPGCRALALEYSRQCAVAQPETDPLSLQQLLVPTIGTAATQPAARCAELSANYLLSRDRWTRLAVEELIAQVTLFQARAVCDATRATQLLQTIDVLRKSGLVTLAQRLEQAITQHTEPLGPLALAIHRRFLILTNECASMDTPISMAPMLDTAMPLLGRLQAFCDDDYDEAIGDNTMVMQLIDDLQLVVNAHKYCGHCYRPMILSHELVTTGMCHHGCHQYLCGDICRQTHNCEWRRLAAKY